MNNQEIFSKVRGHLLAQGEKAEWQLVCKPYICGSMLLTPDGKRCAIGCLIPPELYSERMEGAPVRSAWIYNGLLSHVLEAVGITEEQVGLLTLLQAVHDEFEPEEWRCELTRIAIDNDLHLEPLLIHSQWTPTSINDYLD